MRRRPRRRSCARSLGLDRPIVVQYGDFVGRVATGDLGISYRNQRPVVELIAERLPATLELVFVATILLSLAVGIPLGVLCALHPDGHAGAAHPDRVPDRHLDADLRDGIALILVFAVVAALVCPPSAAATWCAIGWLDDGLPHARAGWTSLILPSITLALYPADPDHAAGARRDDRRPLVGLHPLRPGARPAARATSISVSRCATR